MTQNFSFFFFTFHLSELSTHKNIVPCRTGPSVRRESTVVVPRRLRRLSRRPPGDGGAIGSSEEPFSAETTGLGGPVLDSNDPDLRPMVGVAADEAAGDTAVDATVFFRVSSWAKKEARECVL